MQYLFVDAFLDEKGFCLYFKSWVLFWVPKILPRLNCQVSFLAIQSWGVKVTVQVSWLLSCSIWYRFLRHSENRCNPGPLGHLHVTGVVGTIVWTVVFRPRCLRSLNYGAWKRSLLKPRVDRPSCNKNPNNYSRSCMYYHAGGFTMPTSCFCSELPLVQNDRFLRMCDHFSFVLASCLSQNNPAWT